MVLTLLKQAIQKNSATSKGFLIDGYPRELDQGKRFEAEVASVERVIYFQVLNIAIRIVFTQSPRSGSGILRWTCLLSVSVCSYISETTDPNFAETSVHCRDSGSIVMAALQCVMYFRHCG